jgi:thiosulfate/3-mercaptopyruvate sulfurtransferase
LYAAEHLLLDARPADRFRGENETIDPVGGHIPRAVSAPALANIDSDGRFLPAAELARRFRQLGAVNGKTVGTYCGSGVQATHLALALCVAGVTDRADVYIGSWSDWITRPERPTVLG